jgi:PTS system nitrogen regulatory IIA component
MTESLEVRQSTGTCSALRIAKVSLDNKKKVFETLAGQLADAVKPSTGISINEILLKLLERERLGSTVIDNGLAIPHARTDKLSQAKGALLILNEPVEFDDAKHGPVSVVFGLIIPDAQCEAHIDHLRDIASLAQNETTMHILSHTNDTEVLSEWLKKKHPQLANLLQ